MESAQFGLYNVELRVQYIIKLNKYYLAVVWP